MGTPADISRIQTSYVVPSLPDRKRQRDDRDNHFERQMKDIEDEEGRIHERAERDDARPDADGRKPEQQPPNRPRPLPRDDQDGKRHIDFEA